MTEEGQRDSEGKDQRSGTRNDIPYGHSERSEEPALERNEGSHADPKVPG